MASSGCPNAHARGCVIPIEQTTKATSKSHLSDDVFDVWDEAWPDELDTDPDVTLDVGQDLPVIPNDRDRATNQTSILVVTLLMNPTVAHRVVPAFWQGSVEWQCERNGLSSQSRQVH